LIETLPLYWSNAKTLVDRHSFDLHLNISFYLRISYQSIARINQWESCNNWYVGAH